MEFLLKNKIPFIIFKQNEEKNFIFKEKIFPDYTIYFKNKQIQENAINEDKKKYFIQKKTSYGCLQRKIKFDDNNDIDG